MLESNSSLNADIAADIRTAAMTVLGGWSAPSAAGFEALATQASAAAEALLELGSRAAKPLLEYADLLEAAQKAFNRARARADSAGRDLDSAESSKDERRAESDLEDARADMSEAGQAALMANQAAAQAIEGLMGGIPPAPPAPGAPAGAGLLTWLGSLWNDDTFGAQLFPFHPSNDGFTSAKWFVDRLLDLGIGIAGGAAGARAAALRAGPACGVTSALSVCDVPNRWSGVLLLAQLREVELQDQAFLRRYGGALGALREGAAVRRRRDRDRERGHRPVSL